MAEHGVSMPSAFTSTATAQKQRMKAHQLPGLAPARAVKPQELLQAQLTWACCSGKKRSFKSAIICNWEEKSSSVWHRAASESQSPSCPSPLTQEANSQSPIPACRPPHLPWQVGLGQAQPPRLRLSPQPSCKGRGETPDQQGTVWLFAREATRYTRVSSWPHPAFLNFRLTRTPSPQCAWFFETLPNRFVISGMSGFVPHFDFQTSSQVVPVGLGLGQHWGLKGLDLRVINVALNLLKKKKNPLPEKANFLVFLWRLCER